MASTLLFLTDNGSSSAVHRHWIMVILLTSLLAMDNTIILMIQAASLLNIYSLSDSTTASNIGSQSASTFQLITAENIRPIEPAIYSIKLPSVHNVTNLQTILKISSIDFSSKELLFEINTLEEIPKPILSKAILYGFLGVTVTNLCALMGAICIPIKRHNCYPLLISFMISLAVGALMSTAVLVLIPEAMRMVDLPTEFGGQGRTYLWKMFGVILGTVAFYCLEYFLYIMPKLFKCRKASDEAIQANGDVGNDHPQGLHGHSHNLSVSEKTTEEGSENTQNESDECDVDDIIIETETCCNFDRRQFVNIAPVAWMILLGDGFHNLMDGLTIGAGFSKSPVLGLTLSLSILFEELPHELGDFAILLSSGLSVKAALACNFLSACSAYLGLMIGLAIGEVPSGALYVFAITAGLFLYISLSDMLPQLRINIEEADQRSGNTLDTFLLQLFGIIVGIACVVGVTLLSDFISF